MRMWLQPWILWSIQPTWIVLSLLSELEQHVIFVNSNSKIIAAMFFFPLLVFIYFLKNIRLQLHLVKQNCVLLVIKFGMQKVPNATA